MRINNQQWQWIFYDWANSGYGILVVTAVLPVYFKAVTQQAGVSAADSTAYWGYANSFGTLVVFRCWLRYWASWPITRMPSGGGCSSCTY